MTRNEQLKQIFAQAVELVIGKQDVKLHCDMNKLQITEALVAAGIGNARDTAQRIISAAHSLDAKQK
jgi:hypothetical protein